MPCGTAAWLAMIPEPGVRLRAERLYQQLDLRQSVRQEARTDLPGESRRHHAVGLQHHIPAIGCDFHPAFQQIAFVGRETGDCGERQLEHREEAKAFYRDHAVQGKKVRVGMEASGHARWFERLLAELRWVSIASTGALFFKRNGAPAHRDGSAAMTAVRFWPGRGRRRAVARRTTKAAVSNS